MNQFAYYAFIIYLTFYIVSSTFFFRLYSFGWDSVVDNCDSSSSSSEDCEATCQWLLRRPEMCTWKRPVSWCTDKWKHSTQSSRFLADRTNGRAYTTVLRPSVVCLSSVIYVVAMMTCRCVLLKICPKKQIGNGYGESNGHVTNDVTLTLNGQGHDRNTTMYLENSWISDAI